MSEISPVEAVVLRELGNGREVTTRWMARKCQIRCADASQMLYGMASRGLIAVRRCGVDRRRWWRIVSQERAR